MGERIEDHVIVFPGLLFDVIGRTLDGQGAIVRRLLPVGRDARSRLVLLHEDRLRQQALEQGRRFASPDVLHAQLRGDTHPPHPSSPDWREDDVYSLAEGRMTVSRPAHVLHRPEWYAAFADANEALETLAETARENQTDLDVIRHMEALYWLERLDRAVYRQAMDGLWAILGAGPSGGSA